MSVLRSVRTTLSELRQTIPVQITFLSLFDVFRKHRWRRAVADDVLGWQNTAPARVFLKPVRDHLAGDKVE